MGKISGKFVLENVVPYSLKMCPNFIKLVDWDTQLAPFPLVGTEDSN